MYQELDIFHAGTFNDCLNIFPLYDDEHMCFEGKSSVYSVFIYLIYIKDLFGWSVIVIKVKYSVTGIC